MRKREQATALLTKPEKDQLKLWAEEYGYSQSDILVAGLKLFKGLAPELRRTYLHIAVRHRQGS